MSEDFFFKTPLPAGMGALRDQGGGTGGGGGELKNDTQGRGSVFRYFFLVHGGRYFAYLTKSSFSVFLPGGGGFRLWKGGGGTKGKERKKDFFQRLGRGGWGIFVDLWGEIGRAHV